MAGSLRGHGGYGRSNSGGRSHQLGSIKPRFDVRAGCGHRNPSSRIWPTNTASKTESTRGQLSLAIVKVLRGSESDRQGMRVKLGWLLILAVVIQVVAFKLIFDDPSAVVAKTVVLAVTTAMLFVGLAPNLRWWAFRLMALGLILNTLVIAANGGLMPATPENAAIVFGTEAVAGMELGETPYPRVAYLAGVQIEIAKLPQRSQTRGSRVADRADRGAEVAQSRGFCDRCGGGVVDEPATEIQVLEIGEARKGRQATSPDLLARRPLQRRQM